MEVTLKLRIRIDENGNITQDEKNRKSQSANREYFECTGRAQQQWRSGCDKHVIVNEIRLRIVLDRKDYLDE